MVVQLRPVNNELIAMVPMWSQKPELKEYFRSWPALQDWNRADLVQQRLEWAYGIYEDERIVGFVSLYYPNHVAKTVEMGMLIDRELTNNRKVVSFEAHKQMLEYVFTKLEYQKVSMRILSTRTKLRDRLCEFGYVVEGHLKRSVKLDGQLRDEFFLSFFKE